jgi:hypothetical protein
MEDSRDTWRIQGTHGGFKGHMEDSGNKWRIQRTNGKSRGQMEDSKDKSALMTCTSSCDGNRAFGQTTEPKDRKGSWTTFPLLLHHNLFCKEYKL